MTDWHDTARALNARSDCPELVQYETGENGPPYWCRMCVNFSGDNTAERCPHCRSRGRWCDAGTPITIPDLTSPANGGVLLVALPRHLVPRLLPTSRGTYEVALLGQRPGALGRVFESEHLAHAAALALLAAS